MLDNTILGIILTIIAPFGALGIASGARKLGLAAEGSRKLVHILLSNWILLALAVYRSAWAACILPACFIPLNYISYRKGIFSAIERDIDNSPGTVWYAVSLFILCLTSYTIGMPWIAACGMLAMGYGDGFGAIVGMRWGKMHFPDAHSKKSFEGMLTVALLSGLAVWIACAIYAPDQTPYFPLRAALACAAPAAAIELFTPRGIDNLTLPLGVSAIVLLLIKFPLLWPVFAVLGISIIILLLAYYLCAISYWALYAAALLGVSLFLFAGWPVYTALVLFFVLGSVVSHIGGNKKASANALHERQGPRSVAQVAANGLPSLIFAAIYHFNGVDSCLLAAFACLAAATADTFASEIGMLSKKEPVSVLNLKPIMRGMSGGVTTLGLAGAALGSLMISIIAAPLSGLRGILSISIAGLISSVVDSLIGAAFQAKYKSNVPSDAGLMDQLTERESFGGEHLVLEQGFRWVNNDVVNFASILICGMFVAFIL